MKPHTDKYLDIILSAIDEFQMRENYPFCLDILNTCVQHFPNYAELYKTRGYIHYVQGNQQSAVVDFTKAIGLQRKADYFGYRGKAFCELREWNKAIDDFTNALALEEHPAWFHWRGLSYSQIEFEGKAIDDFTEAIRLSPEDTGNYFQRAQSYFRMWQFQKALDDLDKCVELNPDHDSAKKLKLKYLELSRKMI